MLQGKYYFYKGNKESHDAYQEITSFYADKRTHTITDANYVFPYGGDGSMLGTLKTLLETMRNQSPQDRWPTQVLGIHYGGQNSKGYLMNPPINDSFDLSSMVQEAQTVTFYPLEAEITDIYGQVFKRSALNDIVLEKHSLTNQASLLDVSVYDSDGKKSIQTRTAGNGLIACTWAGSYAYNFKAHGKEIPLSTPDKIGIHPICDILAESSISKHLDDTSVIEVEVLNPEKRPVVAFADNETCVQNVSRCKIWMNKEIGLLGLLGKNNPIIKRQALLSTLQNCR